MKKKTHKQAWTHEQYLEKIKSTNYIPLEKYITQITKILHRCKICGHEWMVRPNHIIRGNGCPECYKNIKTKTHEQYLEEIKDRTVEPLEKYTHVLTKILHRCKICGHEWMVRPNSILNDRGCPECEKTKNIKTHEQYLKEIKNFNIQPLERYIRSYTHILHKCSICSHEWKSTPNNILNGGGCPECYKKIKTKTNEQYLEEIKDRTVEPLEKYIKDKIKILHRCKICGYEWNIIPNGILIGHNCPKCRAEITRSKDEKEIEEYINSLGISTKHSDRSIIDPLELDIVIPSKKIAIEYNGLYWHSEQQGKDKKYHLNKTNLCKEKGYQLIHIFEDEWRDKQQIVKNRLKHILGLSKFKIYGRKTEVVSVDSKTSARFLDKYHLQGKGAGAKYKYGLAYKGKLVALMTFGGRRVCMGKKSSEEGEYELIRYVTASDITIIGGAGKLLKYFERKHNPTKMISYADIRWSNGNLYRQLGFENIHISSPSYFYIVDGKREYRFKYRKNVLKDKLKTFNPDLTEYENCLENGIYRIWDCGCFVFEKTY